MDIFKQTSPDGTLRMNKFFGLFDNPDEISIPELTETQIEQFQIYVSNLIESFNNKDADVFLRWLKKIVYEINMQLPEEYFRIFINFKIFDLMINIMLNYPINEFQIYAILILLKACYFSNKVLYGLPFITDQNLFLKFMKAPPIETPEINSKYSYISLYYSNLVHINLMNSPELSKAFYDSGLYHLFIKMCEPIEKKEYDYIYSWSSLITYFSSSKFPFPENDKVLLLQIYDKMYSNIDYPHYISAIDQLIDSSNDELNHIIFQTDIYSNLITILVQLESETDMTNIENRKICMFILYKMILKDKNYQLDLSFLPIDIVSDLMQKEDVSDQVSALQLLTIYLKKGYGKVKYSIITELIKKGVYDFLMKNYHKLSFGPKSIMVEFFILSLIQATPTELSILNECEIFGPVLENMDWANIDLVNLINIFLKAVLNDGDLFAKFILPYSQLIFQIAEETDPQNASVIDELCARIDKAER